MGLFKRKKKETFREQKPEQTQAAPERTELETVSSFV